MFTGLAKNKFEEWYFKKHVITEMEYNELLPHHKKDIYEWFYNLDISFQFGVIEDFADNFNYNIQCYKEDKDWYIGIYHNCYVTWEDWVNIEKITRNEARLECIKALNELLNK